MSQHYTRSTVSVLAWCNTCRRNTLHRVDDRRLGPCMESHREGPSQKQLQEAEKREEQRQQPGLFAW